MAELKVGDTVRRTVAAPDDPNPWIRQLEVGDIGYVRGFDDAGQHLSPIVFWLRLGAEFAVASIRVEVIDEGR